MAPVATTTWSGCSASSSASSPSPVTSSPVRIVAPFPRAWRSSQRPICPYSFRPGSSEYQRTCPPASSSRSRTTTSWPRAAAIRAYSSPAAGADHERLLSLRGLDERPRAPAGLPSDLRVVDALDASAPDHASPAVVRGHTAADVLLPALPRLAPPLGVGEELAGEEDRVGLLGGEDVLGDLRVRDPPDEEDGLVRDLLDGLRVAALPAGLVRHRRMDERVVDAGGEIHVVHIRLALEIADDLLHVLQLEVAGPEGR